MKKSIVWLLILMLVLIGCAQWKKVSGSYTSKSQNYSTVLPDGWRKYRKVHDYLLITRDGLALQEIRISRVESDKPLPHTKKTIAKTMLPHEVAEVVIDDIRSDPDILNLSINTNTPDRVDNHPGFRIDYTFQTPSGLMKKATCYGVLIDGYYYDIRYSAPARHYYAKDILTFEKVKEAFNNLKEPSIK